MSVYRYSVDQDIEEARLRWQGIDEAMDHCKFCEKLVARNKMQTHYLREHAEEWNKELETKRPTRKQDEIELARLSTNGGTQPRAEINDMIVEAYAEDMLTGAEFPPVVVFYDGDNYWLADGFHRVQAARKAKCIFIKADVRQGTRRDAVLFSVGANATHGLRRSNTDKRRAVEVLLRDEEWQQWSDREIARRCAVHHTFVGRVRKETSLVLNTSERTYTTKHGTTATMNTGNIGKVADEELHPAFPPEPPLQSSEPDEVVEFCKAHGIEDTDRLSTWRVIRKCNTRFWQEAQRGYVMNLDGEDVPVADADATLLQILSDEETREREIRRRMHIQENSKSTKLASMETCIERTYRSIDGLYVTFRVRENAFTRLREAHINKKPVWLAVYEVAQNG